MVSAEEIEEAKRGVGLLINGVRQRLPEEQIESFRVMLAAGEWGLAFEDVMTQVDEYDIRLPSDLRAVASQVGAIMSQLG